ncbi:capping protein-inhibiting regulator of actin dynamics isoform X2 [Heteronotia binoei]|uniref:capping protein-inhibiting regulator of actin dynamics isoform X2 n=1 Tax=Heteronotia binoei TaxID=13085 RepID=UPI00292DED56|nr:capping protein-inhibiting regulator of actin dynamics isoform X2 [Heteronotia binoei]
MINLLKKPYKKKSNKFQPFKKFFGRRKKREATPDREDAKLKPSHSFGNVCNGLLSSDEETNDGLRSSSYSMGTRAFSHDSIFIPDGRAESEESVQAMSQDNILGKVKTLQQQLAKNIKFGQPPQMTVSVKTFGESNTSIEADVLLSSPMETETQQDLGLPENYNKSGGTPDSLSPASLRGTRHEGEEKVTPVKSSRPKRHHSPSGTIETVNLDAIPPVIARLDNSAAKHKLSVKPKNQRVSKKHRRLLKESQSTTEFEQEITETQRYKDKVVKQNGHHVADKPIQDTEGQEQEEEKRKHEDYWQSLEPEQKVQAAEAEVKHHLEHKRLQESQREEEGKKQKLQEEEQFLKMEEREGPEEKRQEEQDCRHKELEEQRASEGLWEWQEQMQQEEQRHQEVEEQTPQEEQKPLGGQRHCELEVQREHVDLSHQKWEEQKQGEEQRPHKLDEQRHQVLEEQKRQVMEELKGKEENSHQELEEKKQSEKLLQQDRKNKRQGQEKQTQKRGHQELKRQRQRELEEQTHKTDKRDGPNQQVLQVQKKETGQRQQEEKNRNVEGERWQGKGKAVKLEEQKRAEEPRQHLERERKRNDEETQQEAEKQMKPAGHAPGELSQLKQPPAEKKMQREDFTEKKGAHLPEGQKGPSSEIHQTLENTKEQDKSFQSPLGKPMHTEEKRLEAAELPVKEERSPQKVKQPEREPTEDETLRHSQRSTTDAQEQERILGEELRWQEVDARQNMPRGFTFQVSSGEKQIIFQKVNLSPVTPMKEAAAPSASKEPKAPQSSSGAHALLSSLCVPHTAILVTGAQLCGTAVNLNQIKDTACKSLLGLTEERKTADVALTENAPKLSPDAKHGSSKMKTTQDPLNNEATLAEWATIRSKILKSAETGKGNEKERGSLSRHSDDWTPRGRAASHGNLRKTLSANAKFSITPAWQKFSEVTKTNVDAESEVGSEVANVTKDVNHETVHKEGLLGKFNTFGIPMGKTEVYHEAADRTEGCKFAKDLPSFLVPGTSHSLGKETPQSEMVESLQNVGVRKADRGSPNGEESVSPFGVKLRRTNYSVRFNYDQQAEQKKKKRYSAGDSFDGVPTPLVTPDNEKEANNIFLKESKSPSQERKDTVFHSTKETPTNMNQNYAPAAQVCLAASVQGSAPSQEKPVCKSPLPQKPALAPKPTSQTPPSSPLSKMRRSHLTESVGLRVAKTEPDACWRRAEVKGSSLLSQAHDENKNEEEESREKKSFFPSITMPWREKTEKKPEPLKRERPVLQSRHSIDGSKLMEKVESAQPLWITLALQKQKGFREQQASREERRQAREAKQAEKLAKENASINNQSDNKSSSISRISSLPKAAPQEEEKKVETVMSRLERREQLKKSNTLPTSVTVEISDSVPSSPLAKEVAKRFSTPDANPVSTEPAWLALAKRKAKAWSDCPQIIK